jgi:hypothetical protein
MRPGSASVAWGAVRGREGVHPQHFGLGLDHRKHRAVSVPAIAVLTAFQARREVQPVGGALGTGGRPGNPSFGAPSYGPSAPWSVRVATSGPVGPMSPAPRVPGFPVRPFGTPRPAHPGRSWRFLSTALQARRRDASASAQFPSRRYARIYDFSIPEDKANVRRVIWAVSPAMNRPYDQRGLEFERVLVCLPPALLDHGSFAAGREA